VTIHDVTPYLERPVRQLWDLCRASGVAPGLLVVPNWKGICPLHRHQSFVRWLHACVEAGAEILLHGERHDEVGLPRGAGDTLRAFGRTAREGEFLTLDYDAARERIDRGIAALRAVDLTPIGFVPPAWLARDATHDAVRDAHLAVSEDSRGIRLHTPTEATAGTRLDAPAIRWSSRSSTRAWGSRLTASARWRWQRDVPLMRLSLHPQDLSHAVTAQSVAVESARWMASRAIARYEAL
jgi:predicted deacetylase